MLLLVLTGREGESEEKEGGNVGAGFAPTPPRQG